MCTVIAGRRAAGEGAAGVSAAAVAAGTGVAAEHAVTLGLIVNELATNAVKYAFPTGAGQIALGFGHRDGEVVLTVSDDGVGLGSTVSRGTGSNMGSRFVDAFARQLGGKLAKASGDTGSTFTVRLPSSILTEAAH